MESTSIIVQAASVLEQVSDLHLLTYTLDRLCVHYEIHEGTAAEKLSGVYTIVTLTIILARDVFKRDNRSENGKTDFFFDVNGKKVTSSSLSR
jgi:hypothetical protein